MRSISNTVRPKLSGRCDAPTNAIDRGATSG
jgi:hypothetical protein